MIRFLYVNTSSFFLVKVNKYIKLRENVVICYVLKKNDLLKASKEETPLTYDENRLV